MNDKGNGALGIRAILSKVTIEPSLRDKILERSITILNDANDESRVRIPRLLSAIGGLRALQALAVYIEKNCECFEHKSVIKEAKYVIEMISGVAPDPESFLEWWKKRKNEFLEMTWGGRLKW